ncbi:hypothetical protein BH24GEM2_BH24GEM2_02960 [soil metagenome]
MRNPDPILHDALQDVVRIHVPSRRRFGCQVENVFVLLIGKRARQFQSRRSRPPGRQLITPCTHRFSIS